MNPMIRLALIFSSTLLFALQAGAADSPQFRGPMRDGIFPESGLMKSWPEGGPALAWQANGIGQGYAAAAIAGDTIYVPGMLEDNQGYLFALGLDGKEKWRAAYGPETLDKQATGSRATPTVDGDRVYMQSGLGVITCFSAADGKQLWQVDAFTLFKGVTVEWAIAESLLVDAELVYATPGGPDASLVALNKMTGETVWTSKGLSEASAYCSPAKFSFGNRSVISTFTAKSLVGVDAKSGEVLWVHPHETDYDIHAVTPVAKDNQIFYTAGYNSGGGALEVSNDGATVTQKWITKDLDCQHQGVVLVDGYIYGTAQHNNDLCCLKWDTGELMWTVSDVTSGNIAYADGMLYVYEGPKRGVVSLVKASPEKFERTGMFTVPAAKDKHWANPAIANGKLYIRHAGVLYAYDIAAR
jgi:outer membrane protein assembly factor BamB